MNTLQSADILEGELKTKHNDTIFCVEYTLIGYLFHAIAQTKTENNHTNMGSSVPPFQTHEL